MENNMTIPVNYTFLSMEIFDLFSISLISNTFIKNNFIMDRYIETINTEVEHIFEAEDGMRMNFNGLFKFIKERKIKCVMLDFSVPKKVSDISATMNSFPGGLICCDDKMNGYLVRKKWSYNRETGKYEVIYKISAMSARPYTWYIEKMHLYKNRDYVGELREVLKNIIILCETLNLPPWSQYYKDALEFENVDNIEIIKSFRPASWLIGVLNDQTLRCCTMAIKAYSFGAMGSWNDTPDAVAQMNNKYGEFEELTVKLFTIIVGLFSNIALTAGVIVESATESKLNMSGWNSIINSFNEIYPGQEDGDIYSPIIKWKFGGNDPLDGIKIYDGGDYWHFVTLGLSELYEKTSPNNDISGYGIEFTFKLKKGEIENENAELKCICGILQSLARLTFVDGERFNTYEWIYTGQTTGIDSKGETNITAFITIPDTKIPQIETANGTVKFVELIGVTTPEILSIKNKEINVQELYEKLTSDITSYKRMSVI